MAKTLLKLKQLEALANNNRALISDGTGGITTATTTTAELELLNTASAGTAVNGKAVIYSGDGDIAVGDNLMMPSTGALDFAAGDVTLTHGAGKLTFGGDGDVEIDFNNHEMTNVDINSGAIDGVTIGSSSAALTSLTMGGHAMDDITISSDTLASDDDHLITAGAVKKYVDASSAGLRWMKPVEVATTQELNTNSAGVTYHTGTNQIRCATNNQALGSIDGEPIQFGTEDVGTRILVKNQAGVSGFLQFDMAAVPANGQNFTFEVNDVYYQINFVDGSQSGNWAGGGGTNSGDRKTFDVKRNNGGESTSTIATSLRNAFNLEHGLKTSGTGDTVKIEQFEPKTQSVTNNVTAQTGSDIDTESAQAGVSSFNGIYFAATNHGVGTPWALQRASDADDLQYLSSAAVFVERGIDNGDQGYTQNSDVGGPGEDIDTQHQNWVQFTGTGGITTSSGVNKVGNDVRLDFAAKLTSAGLAHDDKLAFADSGSGDAMKRCTVKDIIDIAGSGADLSVSGSGVLSLANDAVGANQIDMAEFTVNISNAGGQVSDNVAVTNTAQSDVDAMQASPLTQVYFNGLRLSKAASEANAQGSNAAHGDYFLKRVDNNNIQICFDGADYVNNEKLQLIIMKS